mmetsp:Transcript_12110/g.19719  ORF Transcript_12110/g.19719 Transcript_12110/m.19719 type:complete len:335 (-) Transcript_12110:924-1928(-)
MALFSSGSAGLFFCVIGCPPACFTRTDCIAASRRALKLEECDKGARSLGEVEGEGEVFCTVGTSRLSFAVSFRGLLLSSSSDVSLSEMPPNMLLARARGSACTIAAASSSSSSSSSSSCSSSDENASSLFSECSVIMSLSVTLSTLTSMSDSCFDSSCPAPLPCSSSCCAHNSFPETSSSSSSCSSSSVGGSSSSEGGSSSSLSSSPVSSWSAASSRLRILSSVSYATAVSNTRQSSSSLAASLRISMTSSKSMAVTSSPHARSKTIPCSIWPVLSALPPSTTLETCTPRGSSGSFSPRVRPSGFRRKTSITDCCCGVLDSRWRGVVALNTSAC